MDRVFNRSNPTERLETRPGRESTRQKGVKMEYLSYSFLVYIRMRQNTLKDIYIYATPSPSPPLGYGFHNYDLYNITQHSFGKVFFLRPIIGATIT